MNDALRERSEPSSDEPAPRVITPDMLAPESLRRDFERGLSYVPKLTLLLIAANVVMFIVQLGTGALSDQESILRAGALHRGSVLQGEVWRLVSCMFLHNGRDHLLGNCLVLYVVGMACEHGVGWCRTAVVYFFSGLSGSLLSVATSPGPSVGAFGAIFGLTGGLIIFLYRQRAVFYVREKRIGAVLGAWAAYQIIVGFMTPFVDNFAHIGGLLGGALCLWPMKPKGR
ncbi:MAG: rhomboid family intramembrane serine protease [Pedosphaera sp.]|nr:rhomboid family intramembrane serine protease [Pedosphaera sp.]